MSWVDDILANAAPRQKTLEEIDAEREAERRRVEDAGFRPWTQPGDAGSSTKTSGSDSAGKAVWSGHSTAGDAAIGAAGGVMTGLGLNPREMLGDAVGGRVQMAHENSPWAAGAGQVVGEAVPQALLGLGPFVGGVLSGVGNTEGTSEDKLRGGIAGGIIGKVGSATVGKLTSLLRRKGAEYLEQRATRGLMKRGASPENLANIDAEGGRIPFYNSVRRLGIDGKPLEAARTAERVANEKEVERAVLEARHAGVRLDPYATAGAVRTANPYPGVARMNRAANRAADDVMSQAPLGPTGLPIPGPRGGLPLKAADVQRSYYGSGTNFASGSPNQVMGKRVHGALNREMEYAMNQAKPGEGTLWRQAGRDENVAITMRDAARAAADRARAAPRRVSDWGTAGILPLINANRHAVAEKVYGGLQRGANIGEGSLAVLNAARAPQVVGGHVGAAAAPALGTPEAQRLPGYVTGPAGMLRGDVSAPAIQHLTENMPGAENLVGLDQAALGLLQSPSQGAELGRFRSQLAAAAGSSEPGAMKQAILRLVMTDPEFRANALPLLRGWGGP